jgi:predicted Fe-Mo cluster-binding NifX family protein
MTLTERCVQYVAIPTDDGGVNLAHFGRASVMAVFAVENGQIVSRHDRVNPDPEHLDPAHHRVMLDLVRDCRVVIAAHIGTPMIASLTRLDIRVLGAPSESVDRVMEAYLDSLRGGPPLETLDPAATVDRRQHATVDRRHHEPAPQ